MTDNNPKLCGEPRIFQNRAHDDNYIPIYFKPLIGEPKPMNPSELPQIEEQKEAMDFVANRQLKVENKMSVQIHKNGSIPLIALEEAKSNSLFGKKPHFVEKSFQNYGFGLKS